MHLSTARTVCRCPPGRWNIASGRGGSFARMARRGSRRLPESWRLLPQSCRASGYDPLPVFTPPAEGPIGNPELAARYPLVLNSGARAKSFLNSQHHNIPALVRQRPCPLVWIHPQDAAVRGVSSGDPVDVVSPRGRVRFQAFVTEDIMAGSVEADAHGGSPIAMGGWKSSNVNELTDADNRDPISGFPVYKALLCDVIKAGSAAAAS